MSDERTPPRGRLRQHVAEEIRVLLARKRMSGIELGRRAGMKQSTISRRLTGETAFDMDELEAVAEVLGVEVSDLMPKSVGAEARDVKNTYPRVDRSDEAVKREHASYRPIGVSARTDSARPVSAVPAKSRRPRNARPTRLTRPR